MGFPPAKGSTWRSRPSGGSAARAPCRRRWACSTAGCSSDSPPASSSASRRRGNRRARLVLATWPSASPKGCSARPLSAAPWLLAHPPAESLDVEALIETALAQASSERVTGQDVTPFVLSRIHRDTAGESVRINKRLIADNAALAAEVAVAYAAR